MQQINELHQILNRQLRQRRLHAIGLDLLRRRRHGRSLPLDLDLLPNPADQIRRPDYHLIVLQTLIAVHQHAVPLTANYVEQLQAAVPQLAHAHVGLVVPDRFEEEVVEDDVAVWHQLSDDLAHA